MSALRTASPLPPSIPVSLEGSTSPLSVLLVHGPTPHLLTRTKNAHDNNCPLGHPQPSHPKTRFIITE